MGTRNQNSAITNFNVANRDQTSLYLQSTMSAESIRINLQANTVTYFTANGLTQSYPIQQMQAGVNMPNNAVAPKPAPQNPVVGNEPNRRISGQCFNYRAYTRGGNGGLRFLGKDVVERFSTNPSYWKGLPFGCSVYGKSLRLSHAQTLSLRFKAEAFALQLTKKKIVYLTIGTVKMCV